MPLERSAALKPEPGAGVVGKRSGRKISTFACKRRAVLASLDQLGLLRSSPCLLLVGGSRDGSGFFDAGLNATD